MHAVTAQCAEDDTASTLYYACSAGLWSPELPTCQGYYARISRFQNTWRTAVGMSAFWVAINSCKTHHPLWHHSEPDSNASQDVELQHSRKNKNTAQGRFGCAPGPDTTEAVLPAGTNQPQVDESSSLDP